MYLLERLTDCVAKTKRDSISRVILKSLSKDCIHCHNKIISILGTRDVIYLINISTSTPNVANQ